jgi:hypothetical protein
VGDICDEWMKVMVCDWKDVGLESVRGKWVERWKEERKREQ